VNKLDQQDVFLNDTWALGRVTLNAGVRWDRYRGWMPEQRQIAYSVGPVSVDEQTFAERTFFTWNSFGPRIGVTYDIAGDGRTVVKASYGLFWHNPGPGVSADANPNQNNKSVTYTWNDANGDRLYQSGEQVGAPTASSLAGTVQLDPNLSQPYSHDVTAYLERQFTSSLGARVGFVYKSEDDLIESFIPGRPASAYTLAYPFRDIGVDGVTGTSDDSILTLYAVPSALASQYPVNSLVMNLDNESRYKTVEASMSKRLSNRWSMQAGGSHTWSNQFFQINNPNATESANTTRWDFKLSGTYEAPWGIRISPLVRHQAGANFARTISVGAAAATAAGGIFSGTIDAESRDARRHDNVTVFDLRVDKSFALGRSVRIRGLFDLFNITNSNAVETRTITTGTSFLRPTAILAPRTARLGVRLSF
jgi:hypothetical protein